MNRILRGPDGRHWDEEVFDHFDQEAKQRVAMLTAAVQDPDTGRWTADPHGERILVTGVPDRAGYTEVSADPLHEPRIAHLHRLVTELVADFEQQTGTPHPRAADLAHALEDVAMRAEHLRRRPRHPPPAPPRPSLTTAPRKPDTFTRTRAAPWLSPGRPLFASGLKPLSRAPESGAPAFPTVTRSIVDTSGRICPAVWSTPKQTGSSRAQSRKCPSVRALDRDAGRTYRHLLYGG